MRTKITYLRIAVALSFAALAQCNNFALLESMENPAGIYGPRVFVSSLKTAGFFQTGFSTTGCGSNGYSDLICVCPYLASKAGLNNANKFVPWLTESGVTARCGLQGAFSNNCASAPRGSWYNMKKEPVALSGATLLSGTLLNPIRYTENGDDAGTTPVFTGTGTDGNSAGGNCTNWTVTNLTTTIGIANRADGGWTAADTGATCATLAAVYCFEQQ